MKFIILLSILACSGIALSKNEESIHYDVLYENGNYAHLSAKLPYKLDRIGLQKVQIIID